MKIKSVQIAGMHNVPSKIYDLGDMAYLFGRNGAGKSTVMQAIQFALLGYIPGTDRTKTAMFRHANGKLMSVTLTFDNGQVVTRTMEKSGSTIKMTTLPDSFRPESILGELELPVFNFNEFAAMSANKLKDWFIGFLPDEESAVDWEDLLSAKPLVFPDDKELLDTTLAHIYEMQGNVLDKVRQFNEYCKAQAGNYKFETTRLESTLRSLVFYDDCSGGMKLAEIQEQIREKGIQLDVAKSQQALYYANLQNVERLEVIRRETGFSTAEEMGVRLDELGAELRSLTEQETELTLDIQAVEQAVTENKLKYDSNKQVIDGNGICPYTNTECVSIKEYISKLISENAQLYDKQNACRNDINKKRETLCSINTKKAAVKQEADSLGEKMAAYAAISISLNHIDEAGDPAVEVQRLSDEIQALRETEKHLIANEQYEKLKDTVSTDLYKAQHMLDIYKGWEKITGVNALQSQLMILPFQRFGEKISVYLRQFFNSDVTAEFFVGEKSNSFSFGINNGKYIEYDLLSSGEKCLYTLSLLLAITESSEAPLKLVLVDDLLDHLDPDRIKDCFSTLYNSTIQTVIAGVQKCEHEQAEQFVINV